MQRSNYYVGRRTQDNNWSFNFICFYLFYFCFLYGLKYFVKYSVRWFLKSLPLMTFELFGFLSKCGTMSLSDEGYSRKASCYLCSSTYIVIWPLHMLHTFDLHKSSHWVLDKIFQSIQKTKIKQIKANNIKRSVVDRIIDILFPQEMTLTLIVLNLLILKLHSCWELFFDSQLHIKWH
jgi:hypothetical protein